MSGDERSYTEVVEASEPYRDDGDGTPNVEVRVEEREERRRRHSIGDPRTLHRFLVVRHSDGTVLFDGRWTTPREHHNPPEAAKARAFGFVAGYKAGNPRL